MSSVVSAVRLTWRRALAGTALLALGFVAVAVFAFARGGYGLYIVHTGSMDPTYPSGDLVVERHGVPYAAGSVITFEHGDGPRDLVTHRVTGIGTAGISTKGDGNPTPDVWTIHPDQVHGTVVGHLPNAGYAAYFLQQPAGVGAVMTSALMLILLWGLFFPGGPARRESEADAPPVPAQRRGEDEPAPVPA